MHWRRHPVPLTITSRKMYCKLLLIVLGGSKCKKYHWFGYQIKNHIYANSTLSNLYKNRGKDWLWLCPVSSQFWIYAYQILNLCLPDSFDFTDKYISAPYHLPSLLLESNAITPVLLPNFVNHLLTHFSSQFYTYKHQTLTIEIRIPTLNPAMNNNQI